MKRYLLFAGSRYYPTGGWNDFEGSFDTFEEAAEQFMRDRQERMFDWGHIVDTQTGSITTTF